MRTCCFTGHRELSKTEEKQILAPLSDKIQQMITKGVTVFRNGGALGFDTIAALTVLSLKQKHPEIKLYIDAPHKHQSSKWSVYDKNLYEYILERADCVTYVSESYQNGCMQKRNRYMVDNSDFVIAYVKRPSGGSYYTACYAESIDKEVVYLVV